MKNTVVTFKEAKRAGEKLAMLTAYDYSMARMAEACGINGILVGDSLGMVCLGYKDTLSVTMEEMINHTRAVARGHANSLLVSDMPFMSYHTSVYEAVTNAGRLVQEAGAEAVKLEGCSSILQKIKAIVKAQIPVMGHLGLTPQSVNVFGGYKLQGKDVQKASRLIEDAKKLEDCGVFAIVLECIPKELADFITKSVSIPTIGIGAGAQCDGQILVFHDILGMYADIKPKFVKVYENAGETMKSGIRKYMEEVKNGLFPDAEHAYAMDRAVLEELNNKYF